MAVTILDVAKLWGYSKTTVFRAFASPEQVTERTREKVMPRRTHSIIRRMPSLEQWCAAELTTSALSSMKSSTQWCSTSFIRPFLKVFWKPAPARAIVSLSPQIVMDLRRQNMPVVVPNNMLDMDELLGVTTDQYGGARLATRHLAERGHRKIGLLTGTFLPQIFSMIFSRPQ